MKSRFNKYLAFLLVFLTIFSFIPSEICAASTSTVKVIVYDENYDVVKEISGKFTNDEMADLTDIKTEIANLGYVVVGFYSEFDGENFENKLTNNSIYISGKTIVYAQTYKDDSDESDLDNLAYDFNILFNKKKSIITVGSRYYNLCDFISEITKQGYTYVAAYGDSSYTERIPDDTCIDLMKYPNIYVKARGIKFYCESSSGLSKYTYYVPLKEGYTMEDVNKSLLGFFKNGDKLNLSHYSDAAHKNKITDFSYFLNNEDETIPCYTVIYYKDKGPVSGTVYKVTFDYNTPEGKSVTGPSSFTAKKGHAATLETPKCEGYNFVGWFDGDKKVDTKYVVSKNVTLKAHWSEINSEEVNVEINKPEDKKPENNKSEDKKTETITSETKKPADNKEEVKKDEVVKKEELNPILIKWRSSMSFNRYKL